MGILIRLLAKHTKIKNMRNPFYTINVTLQPIPKLLLCAAFLRKIDAWNELELGMLADRPARFMDIQRTVYESRDLGERAGCRIVGEELVDNAPACEAGGAKDEGVAIGGHNWLGGCS